MRVDLKIARGDDGTAYGTHVVVRAEYSDIKTRQIRLRVVDVVEFRGHLHKTRARDYAHEITKPLPLSVELQGKAIVERDGPDLIVMLPDGEVKFASDATHAEKIAKRWFHEHSIDAINVGLIEWRHGLAPPTH